MIKILIGIAIGNFSVNGIQRYNLKNIRIAKLNHSARGGMVK